MTNFRICRFDSTLDIKNPTYDKIKERVLQAGRFSYFEASHNAKLAAIFTHLCRDSEIETFDLGFSWTGVRLKKKPGEGLEGM